MVCKLKIEVLLALSFICCHSPLHKQSEHELTDGNSDSTIKISSNLKNQINYDINKLEGIWTENKDENSVFFIYDDTIVYTDQLTEHYKFKVENDRMIIDFKEYLDTCIIVLLNDSMLNLKDKDDESITFLKKVKE